MGWTNDPATREHLKRVIDFDSKWRRNSYDAWDRGSYVNRIASEGLCQVGHRILALRIARQCQLNAILDFPQVRSSGESFLSTLSFLIATKISLLLPGPDFAAIVLPQCDDPRWAAGWPSCWDFGGYRRVPEHSHSRTLPRWGNALLSPGNLVLDCSSKFDSGWLMAQHSHSLHRLRRWDGPVMPVRMRGRVGICSFGILYVSVLSKTFLLLQSVIYLPAP